MYSETPLIYHAETGILTQGWTCTDLEDLGACVATCENCGKERIRYVHHMQHPERPEPLAVGCICAGYLTGDYAGAIRRERRAKDRARRLKRAHSRDEVSRYLRRNWDLSENGNPCLKTCGFILVVFHRDHAWSGVVIDTLTDERRFARWTFPDEETAKRAAIKGMLRMKKERERQ
jgi:hypothetical protein